MTPRYQIRLINCWKYKINLFLNIFNTVHKRSLILRIKTEPVTVETGSTVYMCALFLCKKYSILRGDSNYFWDSVCLGNIHIQYM